jgi:ribosomal protein S27AE
MSIIAEIVANQYSFLKTGDLEKVVEENRMCMILVRCGNGRFVCPVQDAQHFIDIVDGHGGDYVRDVSIAQRSR